MRLAATDDRGQPVVLTDPGVDWLLGRQDRIADKTARRIMEDLGVEATAGRRLIRRGIAFVLALVVLSGAAIGIDIALEGRAAADDLLASLIFTGPAVAAMLGAGVIAPIVIARRRRLSRTREIMLKNGHCPQCAYRLAGLPAGADSLITCPECGAAWRGAGMTWI